MIRYYVWENENKKFLGEYSPGDQLRLAAVGAVLGEWTNDGLLDELFDRFNRDNRPNGKVASSLSVGDVITLSYGDYDAVSRPVRSFTCLSLGWKEVETTSDLLPSASVLEQYAVRLLNAT